jgi:hypothetical protein
MKKEVNGFIECMIKINQAPVSRMMGFFLSSGKT